MNPIINQLAQRSSILPQNNMLSQLTNLKAMLGKNPNEAMQQMLSNNPRFRQFVEENKGKSTEQIAREHGIDINEVLKLLRS